MVAESVIQEVRSRLVARFRPERIILFGSQARGDAGESSDVDLLIICPLRGDRKTLMVEMDRTLGGLGIARDIVLLTPEEFERDRQVPGTVARPASMEGRVLYERLSESTS